VTQEATNGLKTESWGAAWETPAATSDTFEEDRAALMARLANEQEAT
jgi:hypothetical protein